MSVPITMPVIMESAINNKLLSDCQSFYDELWNENNEEKDGNRDKISNETNDGCCPMCQLPFTKDKNSIVCLSCGIEIDDCISDRAEWRGDDDKMNDRCGMTNNMLLFESSYSTNIAACGYNSSQQRRLLNKLQLWQQMPSKERTLRDDFNQINIACGDKIPKCVVQYAQVLFKMAEDIRHEEDEGHRSDIRVALLASAVFYAAKIHDYVKSYKEIASWFNIDESYMTIGIKIFFRLMCNKIGMTNLITDHRNYVDKFCNNLGLSSEVRDMAHDIANKAVTLGILRDNTPATIAASSIFFVINMYGLNISKALVSRRASVSEVTISKTYQKLNKYLEHLL